MSAAIPIARVLSTLAGLVASVVAATSSGFGAFGTNVTTCFRTSDPVSVGVNVGAMALTLVFLALIGFMARSMAAPARKTLLVGLIFWSSATTAAALLWVAFATMLWGAGNESTSQPIGWAATSLEAAIYAATWAAPSMAVLAASCALATRMPDSRNKSALLMASMGGVMLGTALLFMVCVRQTLC